MSLWLVRHGQTEWSLSGRHTGSTDVPLTAEGELEAVAIGKLLAGRPFDHVLTSPMLRARETGRLAGFGDRMLVHEGLREVDYGEFEGLTTAQIRETDPGWELFRDGSPGGETPQEMSEHADAQLHALREAGGSVLLFGHAHRLRSLAVRFLGLPIRSATSVQLDPGTISVMADGRDGPGLVLWNRRVQPRAVVVAQIAAEIARRTP